MPLSLTQKFPATNGIRWFNLAVFTITPLIALYGLLSVKIKRDTAFFAVAYYIFSMLGERITHLI
jgi:stearoyl-CoA desaturase (Delta-9 desaturase)